MEAFKDIILRNRPKLTATSVATYVSSINMIAKKLDIKLETIDDILEQKEKIMKYILTLKISDRKKRISGLINVIRGDDSKDAAETCILFRKQLYADIEIVNAEADDQELTEAQKEHFVPWDQVLELHKLMKTNVEYLWKRHNDLTVKEFQKLQDYVLLSMYVLSPPRRSKDYTNFKLRNYDNTTLKSKDNYMVIPESGRKKAYFVFNDYKNYSRLGAQKVDITSKMRCLMVKWMEKNKHDYLLVNTRGKQLNQQAITTALNRIFLNNVSSNMLRHSYMTQFPATTDLKKLKTIANSMGNTNVESILKYVSKEHITEEEHVDDHQDQDDDD